ncbi:chaperone protein DnaJ [Nitzschia inconspicua]|uniref:Chaperone protein DnaJ n=1 Tax=Nitzschia inconspicua TaxID=303405 RepID=A0A9K3LC97_9STRA|nr:chaperone protein DnaJ [Nitzschia inconspicua]
MRRKRERFSLLLLTLFCGSTLLLSLTTTIALEDHYSDDYVRQVIEEDQQQYYGDEYYYDEYHAEKDLYNQQQQQQQQQNDEPTMMTEEERYLLEQEHLAQEQADRIAAERERQFQAELDRMDEEQRKRALQQKKKDHRRVQQVLRAAKRNDLYGVLGMRNWNLKLPAKHIQLPGSSIGFTIPGITIKETTDKDIRKQFRLKARQLHPDKNKDGRAEEAFMAAETAAAILSDPDQRQAYDQAMQQQRAQRMAANKQLVSSASKSMWQISNQVVKTAHILLGPFFTSVMILLAIII